jgi:hypothetical protein
MQGMRSKTGVLARVRFLTQDSGTPSRRASSGASINLWASNWVLEDTNGTVDALNRLFSVICICTAVPLTAISFPCFLDSKEQGFQAAVPSLA